jgi:endonuclease/exonuclease/phosphatase family metal-dependent hydrolase
MPIRQTPSRFAALAPPALRARTTLRIREMLGRAPGVAGEEEWSPPDRSGPGARLVVASYNIHKCVGTDGRFDPARTAHVIGEMKADVVALQEADKRFRVRTGLLDDAMLRDEAGLRFLPFSKVTDGHGWHGNAILVRNGVETHLERLELPFAEPRGAVLAELQLASGPLRIIAAHLGLLRHSRCRQAEAILDAIGRLPTMPTLLVGDFNEWGPGRPGSMMAALEPVFGSAPPSPPSFPSGRPIFSLDRILGAPTAIVEALAVHDTPLARVASDHLPIKALVNLEASRIRHVSEESVV